MKTIKELLTLLKKHYIELHKSPNSGSGLCYSAHNLYRIGKIKGTEYYILSNYIELNKPANIYSIYWWPVNNTVSRIKWIEKHLKLNS